MADAVLIQSTPTLVEYTTTLGLEGTTAGSTIIVGLVQYGADIGRDFSVADDVNGAYTQLIRYAPGRGAYCFVKHNVAGGTITLTCTKTLGGFTNASWKAFEVSGLDYYASPIMGSAVDAVSGLSHPCSTGLTTTDDSFIVSVSAVSSTTFGTTTPASGYTAQGSGALQSLYQWKDADTTVSGDTATWTTTLSRVATSVHVAFPAGAGAPPADPNEVFNSGWLGFF